MGQANRPRPRNKLIHLLHFHPDHNKNNKNVKIPKKVNFSGFGYVGLKYHYFSQKLVKTDLNYIWNHNMCFLIMKRQRFLSESSATKSECVIAFLKSLWDTPWGALIFEHVLKNAPPTLCVAGIVEKE